MCTSWDETFTSSSIDPVVVYVIAILGVWFGSPDALRCQNIYFFLKFQLQHLHHQNLCAFIGATIEPGNNTLLMEYCPRGSLQVWQLQNVLKWRRQYIFSSMWTSSLISLSYYIYTCAVYDNFIQIITANKQNIRKWISHIVWFFF